MNALNKIQVPLNKKWQTENTQTESVHQSQQNMNITVLNRLLGQSDVSTKAEVLIIQFYFSEALL